MDMDYAAYACYQVIVSVSLRYFGRMLCRFKFQI